MHDNEHPFVTAAIVADHQSRAKREYLVNESRIHMPRYLLANHKIIDDYNTTRSDMILRRKILETCNCNINNLTFYNFIFDFFCSQNFLTL